MRTGAVKISETNEKYGRYIVVKHVVILFGACSLGACGIAAKPARAVRGQSRPLTECTFTDAFFFGSGGGLI